MKKKSNLLTKVLFATLLVCGVTAPLVSITGCGQSQVDPATEASRVSKLIEQLNNTSTEEEVTNARKEYDALKDDAKALISQRVLSILETQEKRISDQKLAKNVIDLIEALGNTPSEVDVVKARNAYNALTNVQKSYVTNYQKLVTAETYIVNKKACLLVEQEIDTLSETSTAKQVMAVYLNYLSLTDEQVNLLDVDKKAKLEKLCTDKNLQAVISVVNQINLLDDDSSDALVSQARENYNKLNNDQKECIDANTLKKLTDQETRISKEITLAHDFSEKVLAIKDDDILNKPIIITNSVKSLSTQYENFSTNIKNRIDNSTVDRLNEIKIKLEFNFETIFEINEDNLKHIKFGGNGYPFEKEVEILDDENYGKILNIDIKDTTSLPEGADFMFNIDLPLDNYDYISFDIYNPLNENGTPKKAMIVSYNADWGSSKIIDLNGLSWTSLTFDTGSGFFKDNKLNGRFFIIHKKDTNTPIADGWKITNVVGHKCEASAKPVIDVINALNDESSEQDINSARVLYNDLKDVVKPFVTNIDKLIAQENRIAPSIAKGIIDLIELAVKVDDSNLTDATMAESLLVCDTARKLYESSCIAAQQLVTNLDKLTARETLLESRGVQFLYGNEESNGINGYSTSKDALMGKTFTKTFDPSGTTINVTDVLSGPTRIGNYRKVISYFKTESEVNANIGFLIAQENPWVQESKTTWYGGNSWSYVEADVSDAKYNGYKLYHAHVQTHLSDQEAFTLSYARFVGILKN